MAGKKAGRLSSARRAGCARCNTRHCHRPCATRSIPRSGCAVCCWRAKQGPRWDPRWATKDQVHDEALGWFLQSTPTRCSRTIRHAGRAMRTSPSGRFAPHGAARRMAARDGVKLARLIDAALSAIRVSTSHTSWSSSGSACRTRRRSFTAPCATESRHLRAFAGEARDRHPGLGAKLTWPSRC